MSRLDLTFLFPPSGLPPQLGKSKFSLLYEPLETDFELSSFGITAPNHFRAVIIPWWKIEHDFERPSFEIRARNHFRALILPWWKIQTDIDRYLIKDYRSSKISSGHHFGSELGIIFELWSYPDERSKLISSYTSKAITDRNSFRAVF